MRACIIDFIRNHTESQFVNICTLENYKVTHLLKDIDGLENKLNQSNKLAQCITLKVRLHTAINRTDFVSWCMLYTYDGNKMHS